MADHTIRLLGHHGSIIFLDQGYSPIYAGTPIVYTLNRGVWRRSFLLSSIIWPLLSSYSNLTSSLILDMRRVNHASTFM